MSVYTDLEGRSGPKLKTCKNLLVLSAIVAFAIGLTSGLLIAVVYLHAPAAPMPETAIRTIFVNNSYSYKSYPTVSFVENRGGNSAIVKRGIYWGDKIEGALPEGYHSKKHQRWGDYINKKAVAVKLENGCGRMQNRLVVFEDGTKGCVRYRQNTDQIQGELFSFYLAQVLGLPNLAPSTVSIVDLKKPLWRNLGNDIVGAQWNSNKPVVVTQYISNLGAANIPGVFKPLERHLNKYDILNMTRNEVRDEEDLLKSFVELAQWSDLIIFDYLTANLDRIVNNLYNYQWNVNIMDAPAHNLAKRADTDLLLFLDNESGLLHGYRLLKKYEIYHSILLDNLCLFRKSTVDVIKRLQQRGNVGDILRDMFERENSDVVKDLLPTLPDKSVKILNERIGKVHGQIVRCEALFSADT